MLLGKLEAILFAVAKPVSFAQLAKALETNAETLQETIKTLVELRNTQTSGVHVMEHAGKVSLVTNPAFASVLRTFVKEDLSSELTRPSLETLTLIAYRGPMTKPEIEQIRGVNCSLILRNLLMRDMILEDMNQEKLQPVYQVSETFLRHLGVTRVEDLPSYETFAHNEEIDQLLSELNAPEV